jgi:glyoxylase-like metal-dependent hydrolase (beta-lactamase superfamily II)
MPMPMPIMIRIRGAILGALLVSGTLSMALSASLQQESRVIEVEKIRENLFVLSGGGGNTAVFVTAGGVVVVDSKNPGWGQTLIAKVRELTPRPITTIINTHTHFDHVGGNVEFPAAIEVIAHENTKANMEAGRAPKGLEERAGPDVFRANGGRNIAKRTFMDRMSIGTGPDRIDLYYFGRGHTNGDAWVVFPTHRVVHSGDVFARKDLVFLDGNNGASGVQIPDTLSKAAATLTDVDAIITGHGPVMAMADLREFAEFNRAFLAFVREGKQAGRSVDEMAKAWQTPARFAAYPQVPSASTDMVRIRGNVQVIYDELP